MPSLRNLGLFLFASSSLATASIVAEQQPSQQDQPVSSFQTLVDTVQRDGHALRELLSELHPAFGRGVYENVRIAIEAVHRDSPALASQVVEMAHAELVKRQTGGNATTTAVDGSGVAGGAVAVTSGGVAANNGVTTGKR